MGGAPGKTSDRTGRQAWPRRRQARYDYKHRNRNPSNRRAHRNSKKSRDRKFPKKVGQNWHQRRLSNNLRRRLASKRRVNLSNERREALIASAMVSASVMVSA